MGMFEQSVRTADFILQHRPVLQQKRLSRLLFLFDDLFNKTVDVLNNVVFAVSEGNLVGNLIKVSARLCSFAVKSAAGKTELRDRGQHFVDLFGHDQRRKMKHHRAAHGGPRVRRAGGQESPFRIKRVTNLGCQRVIDGIDDFPRFT